MIIVLETAVLARKEKTVPARRFVPGSDRETSSAPPEFHLLDAARMR
jgi:hypothetical protein